MLHVVDKNQTIKFGILALNNNLKVKYSTPCFTEQSNRSQSIIMTAPGALVLGHSFVRRTRDYLHHRRDLNLQLHQFNDIFYHGIGGYCVYNLWSELDVLEQLNPAVVLLDIGSNDLSYVNTSPEQFVCRLLKFAKHLINHRNVVIKHPRKGSLYVIG